MFADHEGPQEARLAGSGSYDRGDHPRSVPDLDGPLHEEAARRQRAYNARQEAEIQRRRTAAAERSKRLGDRLFALADSEDFKLPDVGHPNAVESLMPMWGSGRAALADLHDRNFVGATVNGALAISDIVPTKAVAGALIKGGWKAAPIVWRTKPWEARNGVLGKRQWMTEKGFAKAGQPVHHWAIPQGGWGKRVPDQIKNGLWNLKPTRDAVDHGRIHGRYTVNGEKRPPYGDVRRVLAGTPDWFKAANVSVPGHAGLAAGLEVRARERQPRK